MIFLLPGLLSRGFSLRRRPTRPSSRVVGCVKLRAPICDWHVRGCLSHVIPRTVLHAQSRIRTREQIGCDLSCSDKVRLR